VKDSIGDAHAVTSPGLDYPTGQRLVQAFRAESGLALPFARHCGYVRVDDSLLKNDQTSAVIGILSRFTTLVPSVSTRNTNSMGTCRWLSSQPPGRWTPFHSTMQTFGRRRGPDHVDCDGDTGVRLLLFHRQ
jgi:hypothetical protein